MEEAQKIVEELAESGICTSICFGPLQGEKGNGFWSVEVTTARCEMFPHPFRANSIRQTAWIARNECEKRGWHTSKPATAVSNG